MKTSKIMAILSLSAICLCSCGGNVSAKDEPKTIILEETTASSTEASTETFGGIIPKEDAFSSDGEYDVDLTQLNSSMVYAQVYDMVNNADSYMGKTVKAKGNFSYFKDDATGKEYFAVLISDATACCSQGIEFVLDGDYTYPKDYPALDTEITVTGTFNSYKEGGYTYVQLLNANIEKSELSW